VSEWPSGLLAKIDQRLAGLLGELLAIAGRYDTGDLAKDAGDLSTALKHPKFKRGVLAEGVAALALVLLRERHDLFVLGPDRMPAWPGEKPPPGETWHGSTHDIIARLVAGVQARTGGTVARTPVALSTVYGRAIDAIAALSDDGAAGTAEERMQLIRGVLTAVTKIEEDTARDDSQDS
jgi:hypothetical protein